MIFRRGGTQYAWDSAGVLAPLIIGVFLLGLFIFVEWKIVPLPLCVFPLPSSRKEASTDHIPWANTEFQVRVFISVSTRSQLCIDKLMFIVHIFRDATVSGAMIATFLSGMIFYAQLFFLPQYFQVVRGDSAIRSGILLLPLIVVQTVT
jgi:hypothetical protein